MLEPVLDGNTSFRGGQHDGLLSDRIRADQYRRGINVTTVSGGLRSRPGYVHQEIRVCTEGIPEGATLSYDQIFRKGKFQGATAYDADDGNYIIAVISGIIFRIDPVRCLAEALSLENGDRLNQYTRRVNFSYAGRFLVIYDYPSLPVIVDQGSVRRSSTQKKTLRLTQDDGSILEEEIEIPEIPGNSCLGAFVNNRLHVSNGAHEWISGDPIGGINEDAPITFEESLTSASPYNGQSFSLGSTNKNNEITYMGFLQLADTSTGYGPLLVATRNAIYSYKVDSTRNTWSEGQFGSLILYNAGIAGPRAAVNVNSDIIFLSGDCQIRSLHTGREEQSKWSDAPISREIKPFLKFDNPELKEIAIAGYHNNRAFFTVNPYRTPNACDLCNNPVADYAHCGMVVLEFDNVSALQEDAQPAWAGLWTGIDVMDMISLNQAMYFFSKDNMGINRLYRLDEDKSYDVFKGEERQIRSRIYTRMYDFDKRFQDKEEGTIDYTFSDLDGDVRIKIDRRPNHSKEWVLWKDFEHCAKTRICHPDEWMEEKECPGEPECLEELPVLSKHCFSELDFGDPEDEQCDPLTEDSLNTCRKVELRIDIEARDWLLEELRLKYLLIDESDRIRPTCDSFDDCKLLELSCCETSDWDIHSTPIPQESPWRQHVDQI